MEKSAHIQIDGISHRYHRGADLVLDDISVTFEPGKRTALVGRSGCGKSTLLQIACGMLTPSAGKVFVDGTIVTASSPKWNLMFQEPLLYPWMTVYENASLGLRFAGRMKDAPDVVRPLLDMVGLAEFADANVQTLSGGQQQRAALARSLATEPTALFLDEPFSALDVITRRALQRDVIAIAEKLDITLVLVTHDLDEAALMGQKVVALTPNPGRIAEVLDTPDVLNDPDPEETKRRQRQRLFEIIGGEEDEPTLELGALDLVKDGSSVNPTPAEDRPQAASVDQQRKQQRKEARHA